MCPSCHQNAPIVYRGVVPYCTACNARRLPLSSASVNLAGQPSKVGGTLASVLGVLTLLGGWAISALIGALVVWLSSAPTAGLVVGVALALVFTAIAAALLFGGRKLRQTGAIEQSRTHEQAIFALASHRGGVLRASDVAHALGIPVDVADAQLTQLARQQSDRVLLEVDEDGGLYYRLATGPDGIFPAQVPADRVRVAPPGGARVAPAGAGASVDEEREALAEAEIEAGGAPMRGIRTPAPGRS